MKIGYRKIGKIMKIYLEDHTIYHYLCLGNKRYKPDRLLKYSKRGFKVTTISKERYEDIMKDVEWFET